MLMLHRLFSELRLLPRRLWRHRMVTLIRLLCGVIAFSSVVLIGYYVSQIWERQNQMVDQSQLTRVEVFDGQLTNQATVLTSDSIAQLANETGAAIAYPNISLSVQVSMSPPKNQAVGDLPIEYVTLRGIQGDEPEMSGDKIVAVNSSRKQQTNQTGHFNSDSGVLLPVRLYEHLIGEANEKSQMHGGHAENRTVRLMIRRSKQNSTEDLQLDLPIAGLLDSGDLKVFVDLNVAKALDYWQTHKLETVSLDQQQQHVIGGPESAYASAILYGQSIDQTWKIAKTLDSKGFRVVHQLDSLKQLDELAIGLSLLAILLVSGTVMSAVINFFAISWLDVSSRRREFGIKKAYGLTGSDLLLASVVETLILAIIGCLLGVLASLLLEPLISELLVGQLGLPENFYSSKFGSEQTVWLFVVGLILLVPLNIAAVTLPMLNLCNKPTQQLLG